ncbi:hypothetical protein GCM10025298_02230 [Natronobiforma cellulositropha]
MSFPLAVLQFVRQLLDRFGQLAHLAGSIRRHVHVVLARCESVDRFRQPVEGAPRIHSSDESNEGAQQNGVQYRRPAPDPRSHTDIERNTVGREGSHPTECHVRTYPVHGEDCPVSFPNGTCSI